MTKQEDMGSAGLGGALVAVAVAGAVTGVVLERSGAIDVFAEPETQVGLDAVSYSVCPEEQPVGDVHRGDRVFLTGRNADGSWVEMRAPYDTARRVWVEAMWLSADGPAADLPVVECAEPAASGSADTAVSADTSTTVAASSTTSTEPTTTTTSTTPVTSTTSTTSTNPPATSAVPTTTVATTTTAGATTLPPTTLAVTTTTGPPTTTTVPDTTGPAIDLVAADPNEIWEDADWGGCPTQPQVTSLSAIVIDASGIATVTLRYDTGNGPFSATMVSQGGDLYATLLGPFPDDEVAADTAMNLSVVAVDTAGNTSTTSEAGALTLHNCAIG